MYYVCYVIHVIELCINTSHEESLSQNDLLFTMHENVYDSDIVYILTHTEGCYREEKYRENFNSMSSHDR